MLIDAFSRHSTKSNGTVILLHLRRSTSFFGQSDDYDENIVEGIMDICEHRDAETKPLIFCVVARDGMPSKALLPRARHLLGEVRVNNLTLELTEMYVQHVFDAQSVDPDLLQFIYESSGGNLYCVNAVVAELRQRSAVHVIEGCLEISGNTRLRKEYSEVLIGMALATFEKLPPKQQDLVKNVAMCCQESSCDALNLDDLAEMLDYPIEELQFSCSNLISQGVLRAVMPIATKMRRSSKEARRATMTFTPSNSPHNVRCPSDMELSAISFSSQLLLDVVLSLVLHSQKENIRSRMTDESEKKLISADVSTKDPAPNGTVGAVQSPLSLPASEMEDVENVVLPKAMEGVKMDSEAAEVEESEGKEAEQAHEMIASVSEDIVTAREKDVEAITDLQQPEVTGGLFTTSWSCCG
eukprot:symbB.v1.2.015453.t1/scaffold1154.1/size134997/4